MRIFILATLLLTAVPAAALQIGDGYNNGTYNGHNYAVSDVRFKNIRAQDSIAVGTIVSWSQATNPDDSWLECDGRAVNATEYPQLYAMMTRTPNYQNLFLRAGDASNVGTTADDTIKTHTSTVAEHTHSFEGRLVSNAVSGTGPGQTYQKTEKGADKTITATSSSGSTVYTCGCNHGNMEIVSSSDCSHRYFCNIMECEGTWSCTRIGSSGGSSSSSVKVPTYDLFSATTSSVTLSGAKVDNSNVTATIGGKSLTATYDGGTETAPKHVMTRYFIKAR